MIDTDENIVALNQNTPVIVTFTGGLGAQIISTSIYLYLKKHQIPVFAELSYFDHPYRLALQGENRCSHWKWELENLGFKINYFDNCKREFKTTPIILSDGMIGKFQLGIESLSLTDIQDCFVNPGLTNDFYFDINNDKYLCVHIRRGDYIVGGSYTIPDSYFIELFKPFSYIFSKIVIASDSPISTSILDFANSFFPRVFTCVDTSLIDTHVIMRSASCLICSNSQYSITAAYLNNGKLKIIPKQWYDNEHRVLEKVILDKSKFVILQ